MLSYTNKERLRRPLRDPIRLGAVVGITEDGLVQVQFDGTSAASGKGYPVLQGKPVAVGDRVACIRTRGSYIILGAYGGIS